jgi:hypothetical protein
MNSPTNRGQWHSGGSEAMWRMCQRHILDVQETSLHTVFLLAETSPSHPNDDERQDWHSTCGRKSPALAAFGHAVRPSLNIVRDG